MVNESLPGKKNGHEVNTRFLMRDLKYKIDYPKRAMAKQESKLMKESVTFQLPDKGTHN